MVNICGLSHLIGLWHLGWKISSRCFMFLYTRNLLGWGFLGLLWIVTTKVFFFLRWFHAPQVASLKALQKVHLSSSMAQKFVLNCQKVDDGADDNHHLLGPGQALSADCLRHGQALWWRHREFHGIQGLKVWFPKSRGVCVCFFHEQWGQNGQNSTPPPPKKKTIEGPCRRWRYDISLRLGFW